MSSYEPMEYDIIAFMDLSKCKELIDLGVKEKKEYMITYIFNNGDFVIFSEDGQEAEEHQIKYENAKYAWFLYNTIIDIQDSTDKLLSLDVPTIQFNSNEVKFEVGDYIKFSNLSECKSIYANQVNERDSYEILKIIPYGGLCISVNNRELYIYDNSLCGLVNFAKKVEFHEILIENVDNFLQNMLELNKERLIEVSIDESLKSNNFEKIKQIQKES